MVPFTIRLAAAASDVPAIAKIGARAFRDDAHFNFFCTYDKAHPKDFQRWFESTIKENLTSSGNRVLVAETGDMTDSAIGNTPEVVGWAHWELVGARASSCQKQVEPAELYEQGTPVKSSESEVEKNHCFKPENYQKYSSLVEKVYACWPNRWHLRLVAVSPDAQNCGVGSRLLDWGLDRAFAASLPVALESTIPGEPLYKKKGFMVKEYLEFRKGLEIPAMYWMPEEAKSSQYKLPPIR